MQMRHRENPGYRGWWEIVYNAGSGILFWVGRMDIYDVIESLRRQRVLVVAGLTLLFLLIAAAMFTISDGNVRPRFAARYEATTQLVVVLQGVEELTNPDLTSADFGAVAGVYADLMSSERAQQEIVERSESRVDSFVVSTSGNSPVITVDVESPSAEEATKAAVAAFGWLEERLRGGGTVAVVTTTPELAVEPIDGSTRTQIVVRSEPTFVDVDTTIWLAISTPDGIEMATPLYALQSDLVFQSELEPRQPITITVGPEVGQPDDTARILAPARDQEQRTPLEVLLRRGAIVFDREGVPSINAAAITTRWEPPTAEPKIQPVTVMLLDDEPVPILIGQRRGPIIGVGALVAGVLALLVLALMRDTWQTRQQAERATMAIVPEPTPIPIAEAIETEEEEEEEPEPKAEPFAPWDYRRAAD